MSLFFKVISSQMTSILVVNPRKQEVEIVRVERGEKIVRAFPFEDITLMDKGSKKLKFAGLGAIPVKRTYSFETTEERDKFSSTVKPKIEINADSGVVGETQESEEVAELKAQIAEVEAKKEAAVEEQDFDAAEKLKKEVESLRSKLKKMKKKETTKAGGFTGKMRGLVSKKKMRFQKDGFDLDLTYVTNRIIAMGFPSEGKEGMYRNPLPQVQKFFKKYHDGHFKVYNLCSEKKYPASKFEGKRVAEFPFDDHNPPPFDLLVPFCQDVAAYLAEDKENVVAIHCKAGKGRTGTTIAAFLVFSKAIANAADALTFFAQKRTRNQKGVTIPSQCRYVEYLDRFIQERNKLGEPLGPLSPPAIKLTHLIIHTIPKYKEGGCTPFVQITSAYPDSKMLYDYRMTTKGMLAGFYEDKKKEKDKDGKKEEPAQITMPLMVVIQGDVKFQFRDAGKQRKEKDKMFHFWLNTHFIENNHLVLYKKNIDKLVKDKNNKHCGKKFKLELFFDTPTEEEIQKFMQHRETLLTRGKSDAGDEEAKDGQPLLNFSDTDTNEEGTDEEFEVLCTVKGKFPFDLSRDDGEITYLNFKAGDVIKVLAQDDDEWWYGELNGNQGYFPPNYVTEVKTDKEDNKEDKKEDKKEKK